MSRQQRRAEEKAKKKALKKNKAVVDSATNTVSLGGGDIQKIFEAGLAAQNAGQFAEAEKLYAQVIQMNNQLAPVWNNLGMIKLEQQQHAVAEKFFRSAIALQPDYAHAHNGLGVALFNRGAVKEAVDVFTIAIKQEPSYSDSYKNLAHAYNSLKQYPEAATWANKGLELDPGNLDMKIIWANALMFLRDEKRAIDILKEALQTPGLAAHDSLHIRKLIGTCYAKMAKYKDAMEYFEGCLKEAPDNPELLSDYSSILKGMFRYDEALAALEKAVASKKDYYQAVGNIGTVYEEMEQPEKALEYYLKSLEIAPDNTVAHYNLALFHLKHGNYAEAWPHHEWRWMPGGWEVCMQPQNAPKWFGQKLGDETLLIHFDQGVGDAIQMLRFLPRVFEENPKTKIIFEIEDKLVDVFKTQFDDKYGDRISYVTDLTVDHRKVPHYNKHISFLALPVVYRTTLDNIPSPERYLKAAKPKNYKDSPDQIVVGISWHSINEHTSAKRNLSIDDFLFLKEYDNIKVIDLQYGNREEDRAHAKANGLDIHYDETVDSWSDMSSFVDQVAGCDLVISIDNTTVHVAGALGVPVWNILASTPNWRWLLKHESSPWYSSMRLFRQKELNDYTYPMQQIRDYTAKLAAGDKSVLTPPEFIAPKIPAKPKTGPKTRKETLLVNDTEAWYHWGCYGTSTALRRGIENSGHNFQSMGHLEIAKTRVAPIQHISQFDHDDYFANWWQQNPALLHRLETVDQIVINGEGTIHRMAENALKLLYIAYISKHRFGKNVQIINHSCFPEGSKDVTNEIVKGLYQTAYKDLDFVAVRDPYSQKILKDMGVDATLAFDSLPLFIRDEAPHIPEKRENIAILAGSSSFSVQKPDTLHAIIQCLRQNSVKPLVLLGAKRNQAGDDQSFIELLNTVAPQQWELCIAESMDEWISRMASARILVSGRFHYTIAAACLGTPFVGFEGNTPKMEALTDIMGEKEPLKYDGSTSSDEVINRIKNKLANPITENDRNALLDKLCGLAEHNFDGLSR